MNSQKTVNQLMRQIPSIDAIINHDMVQELISETGRDMTLKCVRKVLDSYRDAILKNEITDLSQISMELITANVLKAFEMNNLRSLQKVINATGVIIHTNLGRAPISPQVLEQSKSILTSYSNLEYNLPEGKRGSRHDFLKDIITSITGAEDVVIVNNNAAAVLLILSTFAKDKEVVVSRGELVEIGGSFRIPSVMELGGAKLMEVGTTNKTHFNDYQEAINEKTGIVMKIHTSNFKVMGFTESVEIQELSQLKKENILVVEDLGSGVLTNLEKYGLEHEPTVQESIAKGADLVSFSGDKLLGGPQAGIIIGKKKYIEQIKKNQLLRALRVDKTILSILYHTFQTYLFEDTLEEQIPILKMLSATPENIRQKALNLLKKINPSPFFTCTVEPCKSQVGGGSLPNEFMDSYCISIETVQNNPNLMERYLRLSEDHIISRIQNDKIVLDARTIFDDDLEIIAKRINLFSEEFNE